MWRIRFLAFGRGYINGMHHVKKEVRATSASMPPKRAAALKRIRTAFVPQSLAPKRLSATGSPLQARRARIDLDAAFKNHCSLYP